MEHWTLLATAHFHELLWRRCKFVNSTNSVAFISFWCYRKTASTSWESLLGVSQLYHFGLTDQPHDTSGGTDVVCYPSPEDWAADLISPLALRKLDREPPRARHAKSA